MRVLVYGLGRSGLAVARLGLRQGHEIVFFDKREEGEDIGAALAMGGRRLAAAEVEEANSFDICIAAPGVPIEHPHLRAVRDRGIETIGEVEWVHRTVPAPMIGVTGTAGKGTVTRWIADSLTMAGRRAVAGGNIDPALSEVAEAGSTLVVELSSFQLERCPTLRPRIAAVLNLGSDHLDRHGTVELYHAAKRNLLKNLGPEELFIYNLDDPLLSGWAKETEARTAAFSLEGRAHAWLSRDGTLHLGDEPVISRGELKVTGQHHIANALAVALACREEGLSLEEIRSGLAEFEGLPGRYSDAGRIGTVRFIEDSIATRSLAVEAALAATPAPVVWIAGGQSKGADVSELESLIREKVRLFIGIGESGPALRDMVAQWVPTHLCPERDGQAAIRCAVRAALRHLSAHAPHGGTVLLAPLAASFDQFRDYRERAEAFRAAIKAEEVAWTLSS
ncbi:MAG TPA: UDP-N-acetylmuramoyl-L-alanine--D-glutamate ligase [Trueperaceae bacterium]